MRCNPSPSQRSPLPLISADDMTSGTSFASQHMSNTVVRDGRMVNYPAKPIDSSTEICRILSMYALLQQVYMTRVSEHHVPHATAFGGVRRAYPPTRPALAIGWRPSCATDVWLRLETCQ